MKKKKRMMNDFDANLPVVVFCILWFGLQAGKPVVNVNFDPNPTFVELACEQSLFVVHSVE